jgi:hypothetical protein
VVVAVEVVAKTLPQIQVAAVAVQAAALLALSLIELTSRAVWLMSLVLVEPVARRRLRARQRVTRVRLVGIALSVPY